MPQEIANKTKERFAPNGASVRVACPSVVLTKAGWQ